MASRDLSQTADAATAEEPLPLIALADRVEALDANDLSFHRELDLDIAVAVKGGEPGWRMANFTMDNHPYVRRPSASHVGGFVNEHVPLYTSSTDAVLSLVNERFPGERWELWNASRTDDASGVYGAHIGNRDTRYCPSPALALLSATLRALAE